MFLKDVYMDGFKCYTDKIAMKNLDRNFTAITGMNGSGKSNIIDAIVFTLDLSTSKYMRVSNLKELINIHRKDCTVSLVFDNREKSSSPPGYESYDEIEITRMLDHEGKSKYKMNKHNSTKSSIESFCKSIGITNNFIVLQGQITKIINMKNSDLKNMIEETAGTRSYSLERDKSLELLSKKEFKLREAREHLKKTISPFYDQLRKEKKIYEENKSFEENKRHFSAILKALKNVLSVCQLSEQSQEVLKVSSQYFNDIKQLEKVESELKSSEATDSYDKFNIENQLNHEIHVLDDLRNKNFQEIISEIKRQQAENQKILSNGLKFNLKELKDRESILSKDLLSSSELSRMSELESLKKSFHKADAKYRNISAEFTEVIRNNSEFEGQSEDEIQDLVIEKIKEKSDLTNQIRDLEAEIYQLRSKIIYPDIDGVYGTVDENFSFVEEKYKAAIMTILGGKAKYVLTRDEEVASRVLQTSDRKISCIPLCKITYFEPSKVPFRCINALQAVTYDRKYEKAFKHLLSSFYLFEDKAQASKCCFEQKVICVTLQGDVYDPRGTLTGGKTYFKYEVTQMSEIKKLEKCAQDLKQKLAHLDRLSSVQRFAYEKKSAFDELRATKSKLDVLEKICGSKIDVRSELDSIRDKIIKATKEDTAWNTAVRFDEELKAQLRDTIEKSQLCEANIKATESRIEELNLQLSECKANETKKKASIKMRESLDEKRKTLIKATVKMASKITRLAEEIKTQSKGFDKLVLEIDESLGVLSSTGFAFDLVTRLSNYKQYDSIFNYHISQYAGDMQILERIESEFGISRSTFDISTCFTLSEDEKTFIDSNIYDLEEKIGQKRLMVSMDPSNFELLEKNTQAIESLKEKIDKLEKDRAEILKSMEDLNRIGLSENKKAFDHINKVMRVFLGYFLPHSDVCITEDYELKVKVGEWKNSLSELSGGQRSLIALCLIFSMLTFKPAPFYIFDEIDAALDLNYTQSIGEIIRKEFNGAQFIVVSLKNNMFDNANRIYRVFIQDHRSKICQIK